MEKSCRFFLQFSILPSTVEKKLSCSEMAAMKKCVCKQREWREKNLLSQEVISTTSNQLFADARSDVDNDCTNFHPVSVYSSTSETPERHKSELDL